MSLIRLLAESVESIIVEVGRIDLDKPAIIRLFSRSASTDPTGSPSHSEGLDSQQCALNRLRGILNVWKVTCTSREEEVSTKATKPRRHTNRGVEVANRGKGKAMTSLV